MRESQVYMERAEACRAEAEAATLANVRERCLRAEQAWASMAERSRRTEMAKAARENAIAPDASQPGFMLRT